MAYPFPCPHYLLSQNLAVVANCGFQAGGGGNANSLEPLVFLLNETANKDLAAYTIKENYGHTTMDLISEMGTLSP